MQTRQSLRNLLESAWQDTISSHYGNRQINSERSLQALFWQRLNATMPEHRRTFIEPRIRSNRIEVARRRYPDLVVCNRATVIAVIEIKYNPKVGPRHKKDMKTLTWIAENKSSLFIKNSRYLGDNGNAQKYKFSKRVVYCWASVHKANANCDAKTIAAGTETLRDTFMVLHAETLSDGKPNIGRSDN